MDGAEIPLPGVTRTTSRPNALRSAAIFGGGAVAIAVGVVVLGLLLPAAADHVAPTLRRYPPWVLAGLGLVVMTVEATVFTILPLQVSQHFLKRLWPGAAAGFAGYVIGIHWDNGWRGLAVSAWVWGIVTAAYLLERQGSLARAVGQAVALKWAFWALAFAALSAGGMIPSD
ncbi:MAG: hypothetical protein ACK4NU_07155 [Brevundimonas sp.]